MFAGVETVVDQVAVEVVEAARLVVDEEAARLLRAAQLDAADALRGYKLALELWETFPRGTDEADAAGGVVDAWWYERHASLAYLNGLVRSFPETAAQVLHG